MYEYALAPPTCALLPFVGSVQFVGFVSVIAVALVADAITLAKITLTSPARVAVAAFAVNDVPAVVAIRFVAHTSITGMNPASGISAIAVHAVLFDSEHVNVGAVVVALALTIAVKLFTPPNVVLVWPLSRSTQSLEPPVSDHVALTLPLCIPETTIISPDCHPVGSVGVIVVPAVAEEPLLAARSASDTSHPLGLATLVIRRHDRNTRDTFPH